MLTVACETCGERIYVGMMARHYAKDHNPALDYAIMCYAFAVDLTREDAERLARLGKRLGADVRPDTVKVIDRFYGEMRLTDVLEAYRERREREGQ